MITPHPLQPGDRVAVLSPAWAAPAYFPDLHAQSMERVRTLLELEPVEYPTTAMMGASPQARAADLMAALTDPDIKAIFASIGGDDLITVIPHLDGEALRAASTENGAKAFFGYSDNTNLNHWLWQQGIASYYGGSTMVHLGPAQVDDTHLQTLRAALFGTDLTLPIPTQSEDYGWDWSDPRSLTEPYPRLPSPPLEFIGPNQAVTGPTWGGCLEVLDQMAIAGRLPEPAQLEGAILILETSEVLPPPDYVGRWVRAMGERGYLDAIAGLAFAQPVVEDRDHPAPEGTTPQQRSQTREARREAYTEYLLSNIAPYRTDLLVCLNLPFGHTRPQLVIPYGGQLTLDPVAEVVTAHYR
ncbi:LD-carboxypeptidase [Boudabousia liubingyangii]|uniref:LD-carboxypeptidase n=1 Tax=Boudabousia liubingyangii TaxID=1921764 RepID=A0A1Q5PJK4_9ACTO|nr:S66 peptidase family protein [Boudabousia liubingyangii]OKL46122.1 LD-carboxypeptidase [Boudabousia liubingyangii]